MSQANKTISEKTDELASLVAWFESEEFSIDEALTKFKQAEKLATEIEKELNSLKNEITVVKKKFDSEE